MSVLDLARKAYAQLKVKRNGVVDHGSPPVRSCEKSELSEISPPGHLLVCDPAALGTVAAALDNTALAGLDLETTGLDPRSHRIRLLSLALSTIDDGSFTYMADCFTVDPRPLFEVLAERTLVAHNAVFDLGFLAALGFQPGQTVCTMLLSQLLHGTRKPKGFHKLVECVRRELCRELDKDQQTSDWSGDLTPEQLAYAADDAAVLKPLHDSLTGKLRKAGLADVAEIECRCLPAVVWMARAGVAFDRQAWEALAVDAAAEADRMAKELDAVAPPAKQPGIFDGGRNWDAPAQVKSALAAVGHTVEATDDDTLAKVDHPLAELIRQYRAASKRTSTYGTEWLKHVAPDGRVYAGWVQIGADSGRMSCRDPNLQNLPRDPRYRRCFIAPPGRVLVKADFSQIELRIAAKVSGDKAMLDAYRAGQDLHTLTARRLLGKEDVTKDDRQIAKSANFGLLYGMGAKGYRAYAKSNYGVDATLEQAQHYRTAFFKAYPGLATWHAEVRRKHAAETRTLAGRRRLLAKEMPDTLRLNSPVQGTGADGLKLALALLWERREQLPGAFPVLAVHDEIVIEADAGQADAAGAWLRQAMLDAMAPLVDPVPVEVDVKDAPTWGG